MKILVVFGAILLFTSCQQRENLHTEKICVSVISDTTDRLLVTIKADPILRLYRLDQNPSIEAWFRFKTITNVQLVPVIVHRLPAESAMQASGDPQYRNRTIIGFYNDVRNTIKEFTAASKKAKELPNSECFYSIQQELIHLSESDYYKKVLIVYSDLFERSFLDLYAQNDITSDKLAAIFDKEAPLPKRLDGVEVVFVFSPKTRQEDKRFQITVGAYKKLLMVRGARVTIQADASFFM